MSIRGVTTTAYDIVLFTLRILLVTVCKGVNKIQIHSSINQGASMMAMKASIANTLLGLKKAGSTSCLAPPTSGIGLASRSLPPSPCASRKVDIIDTRVVLCLKRKWLAFRNTRIVAHFVLITTIVQNHFGTNG